MSNLATLGPDETIIIDDGKMISYNIRTGVIKRNRDPTITTQSASSYLLFGQVKLNSVRDTTIMMQKILDKRKTMLTPQMQTELQGGIKLIRTLSTTIDEFVEAADKSPYLWTALTTKGASFTIQQLHTADLFTYNLANTITMLIQCIVGIELTLWGIAHHKSSEFIMLSEKVIKLGILSHRSRRFSSVSF